ncbi:MAG TPA: F0F1 ATP synthase subunit delta [Candidatus Acidoferrales bacterium]|nr:F0F1 ATP synthase subunit delta [Candidatus Acidoferrales bacterium]
MEPIDLSEFMTTKAEANDFLARVNAVSEKIFQTNFNLHTALREQFGVTKSDRFLTLLLNNNINAESLPAVKAFLHTLQEQVTTLPVLSITIAFEPTQQTLASLSEWFLVNMKKQMLFDISVNKSLVAGASINFNGKFRDFSIRPVFERILNTSLHNITNTTLVQEPKPPLQPTIHQRVEDISMGR